MKEQIDNALVAALKRSASVVMREVPVAERRFPGGRDMAPLTPFATAEGAAAEAERLLAFHSKPIVRDRAIVKGDASHLYRRCIMLRGEGLDYPPEGALVLVIGVQPQENGTTILTVLKQLG